MRWSESIQHQERQQQQQQQPHQPHIHFFSTHHNSIETHSLTIFSIQHSSIFQARSTSSSPISSSAAVLPSNTTSAGDHSRDPTCGGLCFQCQWQWQVYSSKTYISGLAPLSSSTITSSSTVTYCSIFDPTVTVASMMDLQPVTPATPPPPSSRKIMLC